MHVPTALPTRTPLRPTLPEHVPRDGDRLAGKQACAKAPRPHTAPAGEGLTEVPPAGRFPAVGVGGPQSAPENRS
ncbi:hypothetical protein SSTG_06162 [Streptomyces sp. e14]|nr:hypothetical protein SSTG_06162 [Streptomyces sp. e14]